MTVDRSALADTAREHLARSLAAEVGDALAHPGGKVDMYADGVVIRQWDVVERCPARVAQPADDFEESARNAARRLGRHVLRRWNPPTPIGAVVAEVLADREDWPRGLADWFATLDRAGVAATQATVTSWAVGAARAVGGRPTRWVDRTSNLDVPDRLIRLVGGWDAQDAGRPRALLVMSDTVSVNRIRHLAGFNAAVCALLTRLSPERVTVASASQGRSTRVAVDEALLSLAVDRIVEVVGHRVEPDRADQIGTLVRRLPPVAVVLRRLGGRRAGMTGQGTAGSTTAAA